MKELLHTAPNNNTMRWLVIPASVLLFFIVWLVFIAHNGIPDETVFKAVSLHITPGRTNLMKMVAFWGDHKFLIPANIILVTCFIVQKNKWKTITTAVVALSSVGLLSLLKNLIHRQRPSGRLVDGITNFSFPSGHAFMSIAFYGLLIWWVKTGLKNKWHQRILISFLLFMILMIGFCRIYLRVHYATDVVAGFCIGIIWLIIVLRIMDTIQTRAIAKGK
jgi:membrane-associated phospholipid phosphatase